MNLLPKDLHMFVQLRVPIELLEAAGIERVTDREARELLGPCSSGDMSGIHFPYFEPISMSNGRRRWYLTGRWLSDSNCSRSGRVGRNGIVDFPDSSAPPKSVPI